MGSHNLILANLQPSEPADFRALDLYRLLHDFSKLPTAFYRPQHYKQPVQTLYNLIGVCKFNTTPSAGIKDANVFVFNYDPEILNLARSNKIILFVPGELTDNLLPLLPMVDAIVAYSIYEATVISRQLRRLGYQTPVAKLVPPFDIRRYHFTPQASARVGYQTTMDKELFQSIQTLPVELVPYGGTQGYFNNIALYVHIQSPVWPFDVIESLICGKPVVAPKRPPLLEYVIDNFNGTLVRGHSDVTAALKDLVGDKRFKLGIQARDWITSQLDPETYTTDVMNILSDRFFNLNVKNIPEPTNHDKRKWLFRKQVLRNGKMISIPEYYNTSFSLSGLSNIYEILSFLLQQPFNSAYIFDFELGEPSIAEFNNILTVAERMGRRGLSAHFCTDNPIPDRWRDVFKNLSVISVSEGIKQVS